MNRQTQTLWLFLDSRSLGGIETHVLELSKSLIKRKYLVTLCFLKRYDQQHPLIKHLKQHNIPYQFFIGNLLDIIKQLKQQKPAILHTHGYKAGILGRIAATITQTKVISTYHAGEPGTGMMALYNLIDKITAPLAHHIVAVSDSIAKQLPQRTHVLNNFVPINTQTITVKPLPKYPHIAFVGRLSHEKGPDLFIKLAQLQTDFDYHLYGEGHMMDELQTYSNSVTFHGRSDMSQHWHNIDLLVITSRYEALPLVTLEAMSHGIPVIAPAIGALPKLITTDHTGWLCDPTNTRQLASLLKQWQSLSLARRQQMALCCQTRINNEYSDDAIIPKLEVLYHHLASTT